MNKLVIVGVLLLLMGTSLLIFAEKDNIKTDLTSIEQSKITFPESSMKLSPTPEQKTFDNQIKFPESSMRL